MTPASVEPQVCVVMPLFGDHRAARVVDAVVGGWLAQDVPCEVVVAVAGEMPVRLPPAAAGRARVLRADATAASPGLLRNLAAATTGAPLLYLTDADVVPLGTDFLTRALRLRGRHVMVQPWMYRLVGPVPATGVAAWRPPAGTRVCLVTADATGRLLPVPAERFRRQGPLLWVDLPAELADPLESPELAQRAPYHWGAILVERRLFERVGGYCPDYSGWGCEDDDLQIKLAARTKLIPAWVYARALACLHFEHPRRYATALEGNLAVLNRRAADGAEAMITEDRRRHPAGEP